MKVLNSSVKGFLTSRPGRVVKKSLKKCPFRPPVSQYLDAEAKG
jgi:hypothetical protein